MILDVHLKKNLASIDSLPVHEDKNLSKESPLNGIKIIDFTHFIAGPFATMMLADMGADVVKIESIGKGDDFRQYPPFMEDLGSGPPFFWSNRNKRSIALDLKNEKDKETVFQLIAQADILVENFSTGVMDRLGFSYEKCHSLNKRIIYCSVSAYGRNGKFSDRLGFDPIVQAESGFISMNGYSDREGVRALSPVMDISTGTMTCNAILGALFARERTKKGQFVEVSLFDNSILMTGYASMQLLFSGKEPARTGNNSPDTCPSGIFNAKDKAFLINCGSTAIFKRLMNQVVSLPSIAENEKYATNKDRLQYRNEIFEALQNVFITKPWSYWKDLLKSANVPSGEIRTVNESILSEECKERKIFSKIKHPTMEWVPNMRLPIQYSDTPLVDPKIAPKVGEHNGEIIKDWLGK